jgi:hypothetical protein
VVLGVLGLRGFPQACYSNLKKVKNSFIYFSSIDSTVLHEPASAGAKEYREHGDFTLNLAVVRVPLGGFTGTFRG